MLAARYNGTHPGFGVVTRFSVWNEPNLEQFLTPQFEGTKIVSPATYAKLYMAAYNGIKAGNPHALVAAGETSNRGRNKPDPGLSDSRRAGDLRPARLGREPEAPVRRLGDASVSRRLRARPGAEGRVPERHVVDDRRSSASRSSSGSTAACRSG